MHQVKLKAYTVKNVERSNVDNDVVSNDIKILFRFVEKPLYPPFIKKIRSFYNDSCM